MFKRYLKVSVVKDTKARNDQTISASTDYSQLAVDIGKKAVIGAVIVLGAYIALDTARQVTVIRVASKL